MRPKRSTRNKPGRPRPSAALTFQRHRMLEKIPAIVLRCAPTGNTSRVVTWLTERRGRISTVLKGALRPRSPFLGQYDLFYTCELVYYRRAGRSVYIARECCPLKLRPRLRHDWKACALASYCVDLALRTAPAQAPQSFLYHWLNEALDEAAGHGGSEELMFWLELQLLAQLGLAPRLSACMACGTRLRSGPDGAAFAHERGGLLCAACARRDTRPALPIPPDVLGLLRNWQQTQQSQAARRIRLQPHQTLLIERLLGLFLRYHLDLALTSRDLAFQILRRPLPAPSEAVG